MRMGVGSKQSLRPARIMRFAKRMEDAAQSIVVVDGDDGVVDERVPRVEDKQEVVRQQG